MERLDQLQEVFYKAIRLNDEADWLTEQINISDQEKKAWREWAERNGFHLVDKDNAYSDSPDPTPAPAETVDKLQWVDRPKHGHWTLDAGAGVRLEIYEAGDTYHWEVDYRGEYVANGRGETLAAAKNSVMIAGNGFAAGIGREYAGVARELAEVVMIHAAKR